VLFGLAVCEYAARGRCRVAVIVSATPGDSAHPSRKVTPLGYQVTTGGDLSQPGSPAYGREMPESPEDFYARARAAADEHGRLPVPDQAMWEIFPFEHERLVAKPLEAPVLPEPPREGEGDRECGRCAHPDQDVLWSDDRWLLARLPQPLRLPFAAMLMPRAHLDLGDLDDCQAAPISTSSSWPALPG